jgi:cytochrome c peroxidase
MKKRQFTLIMAGILLLGVIISSCTKLENLEFFDNLYQNGSLTSIQLLGKNIFFDKISVPANKTACADCHGSSVGFTGPDELINKHGSVYPGANGSFGNRKPPSAAYATFSPVLSQVGGVFAGGNFWDGRATGNRLGSPSAEQALGPFLNPHEHNVANALAVLMIIEKSKYISLWKKVWGEKLRYSTQEEINLNFDRVGLAIAAYEGSSEVNQFSSKFDYYLKSLVELTSEEASGLGTGNGLTTQETLGLSLFNGKAKCANCHTSTADPASGRVLFTDFTYINIGVPKNPENPFYSELAFNPLGASWVDMGLGEYLKTAGFVASVYEPELGKFKIPTLRNVDKRPDASFIKAYGHNGYFKSLGDIVHFYNTRDVPEAGWPASEYATNMTSEVGNLGLTTTEEEAIVVFLKTLSDGYRK